MMTPYEIANDPLLGIPFRMAKDIMRFVITEFRVERVEEKISSYDGTSYRVVHILHYAAVPPTPITNKRWIECGSKFLGEPAFYLYEQTRDGNYLRELIPFCAVSQVTIIAPNGARIVWTKSNARKWESEIQPA